MFTFLIVFYGKKYLYRNTILKHNQELIELKKVNTMICTPQSWMLKLLKVKKLMYKIFAYVVFLSKIV